MKKIVFLILAFGFLIACKDQTNQQQIEDKIPKVEDKTANQKDGLITLEGDFVYYADAAVLQSGNEVYGVVINEKMHELDNMSKTYKKDPTDYVKAIVRAKIIPKDENEEGWPYKLDIKEIIKVEALDTEKNNVIKLGSE